MWVALIPLAYLLGTFPSAQIVARASGVDITTVGSGNPGASNVARTLGWRKGAWVFALDGLKGALAAGAGLLVDGRPAAYCLGAAAILGHIAPVTRRFRGGKGVATGAGALAVIHPVVFAVGAVVWAVLLKLTGKASVASIVTVVLVPIALVVSGVPAWELAATAGICVLIVVRHLGNIRRLLSRTEHTINPT